MFDYLRVLAFAAMACVFLGACGKEATTPALSAQEAYKLCTSNMALSTHIGAVSREGEKDFAETFLQAVSNCMGKHHYHCERATAGSPCDWLPNK